MSATTIPSPSVLKAYQVMSHPLFSAAPDNTLQEAAALFLEYNISAAPVLDGDEKAVGVITKTDLARHERDAAEKSGVGPADAEQVRNWMTPTVFSVAENAGLDQVCREMVKNGIHHLFVRDEGTGRLLGVISSFDLLKVLADFLRRSLS